MPILLRRKLYLVSVMVILANAADLASTWIVSPNLANEWNVLERTFGLGWLGIIGAKVIGGALAIFGYSFYLRRRNHCYPEPGANFSAFRRHFSFGRQLKGGWIDAHRGIPFGDHLGVNLGYLWAGMQMLVLWVALDNILLGYGIVFPLRHVSEMGYHMLQSAAVAVLVLWRFYAGNYRRYSVLSTHPDTSGPLRLAEAGAVVIPTLKGA